jgi:hypothetical protein
MRVAFSWPEELVVATTEAVDEDHKIITRDSDGKPWPVTVTIVPGGPIAGLSCSVGCGGRAAGRRVVVVVVDSVVVVVDTVVVVVVVVDVDVDVGIGIGAVVVLVALDDVVVKFSGKVGIGVLVAKGGRVDVVVTPDDVLARGRVDVLVDVCAVVVVVADVDIGSRVPVVVVLDEVVVGRAVVALDDVVVARVVVVTEFVVAGLVMDVGTVTVVVFVVLAGCGGTVMVWFLQGDELQYGVWPAPSTVKAVPVRGPRPGGPSATPAESVSHN